MALWILIINEFGREIIEICPREVIIMNKSILSMPYVAPHENIRLMVVDLFRRLYRDIMYKLALTTERREYILTVKLLETPEFIPLIMPQEIYATDGSRMRVDMAFGRRIVFELKSDPSEFDKAYQDALFKYLPTPHLATAKYFIITNYEYWRIYKIERIGNRVELEPIVLDEPKSKIIPILKAQILPKIEPKLPAHPDVIGRLFKIEIKKLITNIKDIFTKVKEDARVKPLYEAYKKIMEMLYGEAPEEFFEDLFAKHTLMHMVVLSALSNALSKEGEPTDLCSGMLLDIDVALPYLNWWRILYVDPRYNNLKQLIQRVAEEVVLRVNLIDWTYAEAEDVFRALYELLVDPDTRRKIGEYYTPLWIVEYILSKFDLKKRVILDPFCGSGTFLVMAFHRKVDEGEDVDDAYSRIVGFDINPLAVAIARAELILAYLRRRDKVPQIPPHIYHTDTLATWFGGGAISIPEVAVLFKSARNYLAMLINFNVVKLGEALDVLNVFSEIENCLTKALRYAYHECKLDETCLTQRIDYYLTGFLEKLKTHLAKIFLDHVRKNGLAKKLAQLIIKYGGNSVWSLVLTSIYVPLILPRLKVDIIVTNPPWIPTTEFNTPYADKVRGELVSIVKEKLPEVSRRVAQIVSGSDIATAALAKALSMAEKGCAFVMNREQAFYHKSPMPAGIIATYAVLKDWDGELELVDIDYDAFQHGIYPALVIVKKGERYEKAKTPYN